MSEKKVKVEVGTSWAEMTESDALKWRLHGQAARMAKNLDHDSPGCVRAVMVIGRSYVVLFDGDGGVPGFSIGTLSLGGYDVFSLIDVIPQPWRTAIVEAHQ